MNNFFSHSEIPVLSAPVTSANNRNAKNNPAVNLGTCTPFEAFEYADITHKGTVCIIGKPGRGIGAAKALIRRSQKPFLFLGTAEDIKSPFSSLNPEWCLDEARESLPRGNGAIYFRRPHVAYFEISEFLETWAQSHFIIMHLGNGLQAGAELLNLLSSTGQSLLFCEAVPDSIRGSDTRTITPLEFMKQMRYLLVFSSGAETAELIQLLPKYQYEKVTNTTGVNTFSSHSLFHPFHIHHGTGFNSSQSRTLEFNKNVFEMGQLQKIFEAGHAVIYNAVKNTVFVARIV